MSKAHFVMKSSDLETVVCLSSDGDDFLVGAFTPEKPGGKINALLETAEEHLANFCWDFEVSMSVSDDPLDWLEATPKSLVKPIPNNSPAGAKVGNLAEAAVGTFIADNAGSTAIDSVYKCVATSANPNLKAAVRFHSGTLSIKIGGHGYEKVKGAFKGMGLKVGPEYASLHVEVDGILLARKTIGSVLAATGVAWGLIDWHGMVS